MRMRGGRGASGGARTARQGARWEGAVGARQAVRAQKIFFLHRARGFSKHSSCVLADGGGRASSAVRAQKIFFSGARGENIFLVEAFSRAFWRTDGGRRTEDGGRTLFLFA